jgi:hypothetical protein
MIEVAHEVDDAGGVSFASVEGFAEASPNVGQASAKLEILGVVFLIGWVDSVAVGLEKALPFSTMITEGAFEIGSTPSVLPTVADAASWARVVEHPDVSGVGFSGAGGEFFDGCFVSLKVVLAEALLVDGFGDGAEELEALEGPVIQGVARGVEAEALEDVLLPVDREMIGKF